MDPALQETRIRLAGRDRGPVIVLPETLLGPGTAWLSPESLPGAALASVDAPPWTGFDGLLPLLFALPPAGDGLVAVDGDRFEFRLDLVASAFFLLSRYEEAVEGAPRDERDRSPAGSSVLGRTGWLEWPVLDMYLSAFRGLIERAWPGLVVAGGGPGRAILSHDVDHPSSRAHWRGSHALRVVAGDAIHRRDPGLALRRAVSLLPTPSGVGPLDPYTVFDFLMTASETRGIKSTFFFLTRDTEVPDGSRYRVDQPWARRLIAEIGRRGHRIGLHGSYDSFDDVERLRAEWALLEEAGADLPAGVLQRAIRQHFLRFRAGDTWRLQAEAGLEEDQSLGFADAVGYRAGTAPQLHGLRHRGWRSARPARPAAPRDGRDAPPADVDGTPRPPRDRRRHGPPDRPPRRRTVPAVAQQQSRDGDRERDIPVAAAGTVRGLSPPARRPVRRGAVAPGCPGRGPRPMTSVHVEACTWRWPATR